MYLFNYTDVITGVVVRVPKVVPPQLLPLRLRSRPA
jgi:hypothetical protein